MSLEDETARLAAEQSQVSAGMAELATMIWQYRRCLIHIGFAHDQADELVRDFHLACISRYIEQNDDDQ